MQFFTPLARPKAGLGTNENHCPCEKNEAKYINARPEHCCEAGKEL